MILFEWNEAKAESNQRKHGISFERAKFVFADPYALAEQDRWKAESVGGRRSAWSEGLRCC